MNHVYLLTALYPSYCTVIQGSGRRCEAKKEAGVQRAFDNSAYLHEYEHWNISSVVFGQVNTTSVLGHWE